MLKIYQICTHSHKACKDSTSPYGIAGYGHYRSSMRDMQRTLMGLDSSMYAHVICVCHVNKKSAENIVQAYLPGIFAHKGGSVAILSDNGTEFKSTVVHDAFE